MKKKYFLAIAIIVIAAAVFVIAKRPTNIEPIHSKITVGNLTYEIQLNKNQYNRYETITVHTKVTNIGNETYTYLSGSSSCPSHLSVEILHEETKNELSIKPGGDCTADLRSSKLAPNDTAEDTDTFIPKYWGGASLKRAKIRTYEVRVSLPGSHPSGEDRRESAVVQIQLY